MKTTILRVAALSSLALVTLACDEKPAASTGAAASASAAASVAPAATSAAPAESPAPSASAAATASAAPAASAASAVQADTKEVVVTVKDPTAEPAKTVKAQPGGSLTVYLPDAPGTVWSVETVDKTFGKAKEEVIPGFAAGGVMGHQFKWTTANPLLKAGQSHKVSFVNKKAGKPNGTFTLTVEII